MEMVFVLAIGALLAAAVSNKQAAGDGGRLSEARVRELARGVVERYGFSVSPEMLVAMAWIESAFDPLAIREEPHLNDASAGLMQTLRGTARWLATDFPKYSAYAPPDFEDLMNPEISMYFGAAYLDYLSSYRGKARDEMFMVRGYNGGPGGVNSPQTAKYYERYMEARRRFG